jgi:uncharacterized delta-60 repeat protein
MINRMKKSYLLVLLLLFNIKVHATLDISASRANGVGINTDGSIVVAGSIQINEASSQCMLASYNPFGVIDTSYGQNGYVVNPIGSSSGANALTVTSTNVVVVGWVQTILGYGFAISRYNTNGTADLTFNGSGVQTTFFSGNASANAIVVDTTGNYVVAGLSLIANKPAFTVVRYTSAGQLDTSFGSSGIVTTTINQGAGANAVALNSSGDIIAAGYSVNTQENTNFALARYTSKGKLDTSFNTTGIVTTTIGSNSRINAIAVQSNNQIVAGGYSNNQFALARYNTNGSLDTTFGTNGIVITSIGGTAQISDLVIQSDGKIIVVGFSDNQFALARYTTAGILDISFGNRGIVTTAIGITAAVTAVTLAPNGSNIIVAGNTATGIVAAMYNSNGLLDTLFGNNNGLVNFPNTFNAPDIFDIANVNIANDAGIKYSKLKLSNSILDSDINSNAGIEDTKLAPLKTAGKVLNSATTASSLNSSGTIVTRDTLGNFAANTIYSNVVGSIFGTASENVLRSGDVMAGSLTLPAGSAIAPSLQFSGSENTGLSALSNILALSTQGFERVTIDNNGSLTINTPTSGSALVANGDVVIGGDNAVAGNVTFNTNELVLNSVGSTQGPLIKIYTGIANTGLSGSVVVNFATAGFTTAPVICMNSINGISASLTIQSSSNVSATITSLPSLNVPFNYIAIGL